LKYSGVADQVKRLTSPETYQHCLRVAETGYNLALLYDCEGDKAYLAGLIHDVYRDVQGETLLGMARSIGIAPTEVERLVPMLLHAKVAAKQAKRQFGIQDAEIIQAVARHTTASPGMTRLDMVVYLADLVEPGRQYDGLDEIRKLSRTSLEEAFLLALDQTVIYLVRTGSLIHEDTIMARNWLLSDLKQT